MGDSEWACYGTETSRNVRGQEETDSTALLSAGKKKKKKKTHWLVVVMVVVGRGGRGVSHPSIFRSPSNVQLAFAVLSEHWTGMLACACFGVSRV